MYNNILFLCFYIIYNTALLIIFYSLFGTSRQRSPERIGFHRFAQVVWERVLCWMPFLTQVCILGIQTWSISIINKYYIYNDTICYNIPFIFYRLRQGPTDDIRFVIFLNFYINYTYNCAFEYIDISTCQCTEVRKFFALVLLLEFS